MFASYTFSYAKSLLLFIFIRLDIYSNCIHVPDCKCEWVLERARDKIDSKGLCEQPLSNFRLVLFTF